ncbi:MAG TPA: adenylate/guanylate cyclase domain-containing protein, partial [Paracoccaceae bacterium]|nr:adenylate/guanylate cyclase domain-containing protein [Paracoccaceae bacterium]
TRLQALAAPGATCVSAAVRDHVGDRLEAEFTDLGERQLKHIARPVRVFGVTPAGQAAAGQPAAAAAGGLGTGEEAESERPSIVVLPFQNMSGDPEQEFFADGLTEDILTELSRFRGLFVISRNSAFVYKGRAVNLTEIARELGVRYVLEGSVRRSGSRVRVTVQLIDAPADHHIWAERYDREMADIFAIQDEITAAIAATLPGRIQAAAQERIERKKPESMAAYELVLTAKTLHHRSRREDNARAMAMIERAIALEPGYAHAHAWKACLLGQQWVHTWCEDRDLAWEAVSKHLGISLSLDDNDSDTHRILAALNVVRDDLAQASYHQDRALRLNPNDDLIVVQQGEILTWLGRPEEGIEWIRKAMRLNPYHPQRFWNHLGRAYFVARRYGEAIEAFRRISAPDHTHHAFLAAAAAELGDETLARRHAAEVLRLEPGFTIAAYMKTLHYGLAADRAHHRAALIAAGLPLGEEEVEGAAA